MEPSPRSVFPSMQVDNQITFPVQNHAPVKFILYAPPPPPPPPEPKYIALEILYHAARVADSLPMPPDAVPPPPLVTVQVQQMEEEEEEESNDEDDSDYSGEEEEGCGNKRRCRKPANNNKPHKRANRQSNAQDKRESFRALVESNMSTFRGFYREQHRIANERMTPPLICPRSKSGYYYVTPEQTKQYSIRGAHGLRKTKQSFAVSWNSVVFSQLLLDYGLFPGEESVSAEFFDPRDASALNSKMEEWFRSLRL